MRNKMTLRVGSPLLAFSLLLSTAFFEQCFAQEIDNESDLTIRPITVIGVTAPKDFPPFPTDVDVPVVLEGVAGLSDLDMAQYRGSATYSQEHAITGQKFLEQRQVVEGFKELRIAVEMNKWRPTDQPNAAKCHQMLASILYEYALKAKDTGRGSKGMQRLLNAWVEARRALFMDPSSEENRKMIYAISRDLVGITPRFNNLLSLGSSAYLMGNKIEALDCYQKCADLIEKGKANAPLDTCTSISILLGLLKTQFPDATTSDATQNAGEQQQANSNSQLAASNSLPAQQYSAASAAPLEQHALNLVSVSGQSSVKDESSSFGTKSDEFYVADYVENAKRQISREWQLSHIVTSKFPTVAFTLTRHGDIAELRTKTSSGDTSIDELALNVVRRVAPFPDCPAGMGEIEYTFTNKIIAVDLVDYMRQLRRKIRHNWHPPADMQEDHVTVSFKLHRDGTVDGITLVRASASDARNQSSMAAVKAAAPFQHLPIEAPDSVPVLFHFDHEIESQGDNSK